MRARLRMAARSGLEDQEQQAAGIREVKSRKDSARSGPSDRACASPGPIRSRPRSPPCTPKPKTAEATDWQQIAALYEGLQSWLPNPIIALNHAVAVAMDQGPEAGLALLGKLAQREELNDYRYYHAAQAELLGRAGKLNEAKRAYQRALKLAENEGEQRFLQERLAALGEIDPDG